MRHRHVPPTKEPPMTRYIKELATDILLMTAAIIGAVLMLTAIATITHHTATPQAAPTTASRIVPCNAYLSHAAMVTENAANIPPAQHSFCYVTGR